jgi:hypothetical protein
VSLYETFLAGCYEKVEEIDGSSGSFGQFVGRKFRGHRTHLGIPAPLELWLSRPELFD